MMSNDTVVKVTAAEGNALLQQVIGFKLPEKLGDTAFTIVERGVSEDQIQELYRELRARSPHLQAHYKKRFLFGPKDNWESFKQKVPMENGATKELDSFRLTDPNLDVEVRLNQDALEGAFWALLMATHPSSPSAPTMDQQADFVWPLAAKLRLRGELRKTIGLADASRRRIDLDPLPDGNGNAGSDSSKDPAKDSKKEPVTKK